MEEYLLVCYLPCICPTHKIVTQTALLISPCFSSIRVQNPTQEATHDVIRIQEDGHQLWLPHVPVLDAGVIFLQRLSIFDG
jgi:hypothetical protein